MRSLGNDLDLGTVIGRGIPLRFSKDLRDKHLYVCGATGTGKSKFLENLIRQDILNWSKSKCGLMLLDPHGSLFDDIMAWLARHRPNRPIVPIDLRRDGWIVSYNLLRARKSAEPQVIVDNFVDAMAYVWGAESTDRTPLLARWCSTVLRTLYDNGFTLVEAEHLTNRIAKRIRQMMMGKLTDSASKQDWEFAETLTPKEFDAQIGSLVNRLQRFIRNPTMRSMFGQQDVSLDLGKALDEGSIILVSLATERARVSKENAELFATLLLSDLWTAAQERGKKKKVKPFYLYVDEAQRFVSPTLAENLDEARGYGIHCVLSNQFPGQFLDRGENGKRVYNSIMENASSKVVFRLSHEDNLLPMAKWLFMGVMSPDKIKHELYSTKVMGYVEEYRRAFGRSTSHASGGGSQYGQAGGAGYGNTSLNNESGLFSQPASRSTSHFASTSSSHNSSWSDAHGENESDFPVLIPVFGKELSHVQFENLEEQTFRAMAALFDQQQRQAVVRLVGMKAPVSLFTPIIEPTYVDETRVEKYASGLLGEIPFALKTTEALKRIADRQIQLSKEPWEEISDEATSAKRPIRRRALA